MVKTKEKKLYLLRAHERKLYCVHLCLSYRDQSGNSPWTPSPPNPIERNGSCMTVFCQNGSLRARQWSRLAVSELGDVDV